MLFDESFVDSAHARPADVLGAAGLTAAQQAEVLAVDRRAWRTDPLRRRRTLRTLSEEYKTSTTLVLAETRSLAFLEGYFSSPEFHAAVHERRSIALAFGEFLTAAARRLRTAQLADVVRLEWTMARCRRAAREEPGEVGIGKVRLAPGHAVGAFEANVIETINRVERYLFEVGLMPAVALCEDAPRIGELPALSAQRVHLLFFPAGEGVSLSFLEAPAYEVLARAETGVAVEDLGASFAARGVAREAFEAMLASLLDEGILVAPSR